MNILYTYAQVFEPIIWVLIIFLILAAIALVVIGIAILITDPEDSDKETKIVGISFCVGGSLMAILLSVGIGFSCAKPHRYVCAQIPHDTPFMEVIEDYEVIEQKGENTFILEVKNK